MTRFHTAVALRMGCWFCAAIASSTALTQESFSLAPAVALEAEDFHIQKGWTVIKNGEGNYMVDIVGFQHISGERLLCIDEKNSTADAWMGITIPEAGDYRLWVRYEYPAFCEMRFQVSIEQDGKVLAEQIMGAKDAQRFGYLAVECQGDLAWGSEGLTEEKLDVKGLAAGKARLWLKAVEQPRVQGVNAHRNIDLLYLTKDTQDAWRPHYAKTSPLYPILEAFRETVGARYEARVLNRGDKAADFLAEVVYPQLWQEWLKENRPSFRPEQYWRKAWGAVEATKLRPDSTAEAAAENPRLYVDSAAFFEDTGIDYFVNGNRRVRALFGENIHTGLNYGCHPWYYPDVGRFVKWFRRGAADYACHSEYFWQIGMAGPMVNGYLVEHFRCGLRGNPRGLIRQYVMPHSPGNTDANFLRTAFTHLAHGAKMHDFFCIAMNGDSAENYIDLRDVKRYRSIRDVTHSMGLIEDMVLDSSPVPSSVALLISESTERWDYARIATDLASYDTSAQRFRQMRLSYHQERMGIWYALTFLGAAPDLIIEEDLRADILNGYKVLYVVGDCLRREAVPVIEKWIEDGGILMATAGAGRFDSYHDSNPGRQQLLGIRSRTIEERTTFLRPRQELPFLQPLSTVKGPGWLMPQIATYERIEPGSDCAILASFAQDSSPALITRKLGKGRVYYVAALPGLAYLWSAMQPPRVPDRGPSAHTVPTKFDAGARALLEMPLKALKGP